MSRVKRQEDRSLSVSADRRDKCLHVSETEVSVTPVLPKYHGATTARMLSLLEPLGGSNHAENEGVKRADRMVE